MFRANAQPQKWHKGGWLGFNSQVFVGFCFCKTTDATAFLRCKRAGGCWLDPMLHTAHVTNVHSRVYFFCRSRRRCRLPVPVAEAGCRLPVPGCRLPVAGAGCRLPVPVASCRLPVGLPAPVSLGRWPSLDAYTSLYAYTRICLYTYSFKGAAS